MKYARKITSVLVAFFLFGFGLITEIPMFSIMALSEQMDEEYFDLELAEGLEFSEEIYTENVKLNRPQNLVDESASAFEPLQSSITVGNFNRNLSGIRSSQNKVILNLSTSADLPSIGFLDLSANVEIGQKNNKLNNELMRFTIENSSENIQWKFGKYRKSWGDVDGALVLDLINPTGSILNQELPNMEQPSRWLADLSFFLGANTSELFVSLNRDTVHTDNLNSTSSNSEFGLKSSFDMEKGQVSLYLASLFPRAGVIDITTGLSHANRYQLVGFSAHKDIRHYLLKFDLAKKFGLNRSSLSGLTKGVRIDGAFGIEHAPSPYNKWLFKIESSIWQNSVEHHYIPSSSGMLREEPKSSSYIFSYSNNAANDKLSSSLSFGGDGDGKSVYLGGEGTYSISDATKIKANFLIFKANPDHPNYIYDNSSWINFGLTRYF